MSAISSTTAGSLLSYLSELNPQSQTGSADAASPTDLLSAEAASDADQGSQTPSSNILAAIAALGPFNSAVQQSSSSQDSLASFLGSLEEDGAGAPGTTSAADSAANATASTGSQLSALLASNDSTSQAAISQLISSDGINSSQLQMDFLTAVLGSSSATSQASSDGDIFAPDASQNSNTDSPLNILA